VALAATYGRFVADVQVITEASDLVSLEEEWTRLAEPRGNAFVTPQWCVAWLRHYGDGARPLVVVLRRPDGALQGLLPLVVAAGGQRRVVRFAGANLGDYLEPVSSPDDEEILAAETADVLDRRRSEWSMIVLHNVKTGWPSQIVASSPRPLTALRMQPESVPYVELNGCTWDEYLATRSRDFRSQVKRELRVLEREHHVMFRKTVRQEQLSADMNTLFQLHDMRWAGRGGSAVGPGRPREFLTEFAASALGAGWLRLWFLEIDGEPVSGWCGWHIGGRYSYYLGGFDPAWAKYSVGRVLLARALRDATEEGAAEFNLLLGDEPYKLRFATGRRDVTTLAIVPSFRPVRLAVTAGVGLRAVARRLPPSLRERVRRGARRVVGPLPTSRFE
jgi:CelD/BcsL family acetyltransferase involved in cellulose biosynthesis